MSYSEELAIFLEQALAAFAYYTERLDFEGAERAAAAAAAVWKQREEAR